MSLSRRRFLTYVGMGTYAALRHSLDAPAGPPRRRGRKPRFFDPIPPSTDDRVILPAGYRYDLLCAWDDLLGSQIPAGIPVCERLKDRREHFGYNNDFLAFFPLGALRGEGGSQEGLLWVNHEYPDPMMMYGYAGGPKTLDQVLEDKHSVGGSILYVKRNADGHWKSEHHPQHTRRLTALYPKMEVSGPAAEAVLKVGKDGECRGTLGNCSGGRTPWLTVLTCEENYQHYNATDREGYRWKEVPGQEIAEEQFGWIVEVDPYGELPPAKHTSLGRFKHENAAMRVNGPGKRLVVYMGDDEANQFLYKYVSDEPYHAPTDGRLSVENRLRLRGLLARGTLYVADFEKGQWHALDWAKSKELQGKFGSQADVLIQAPKAAALLGATPLDRPEDCEVHPADGSLYVALTNNTKRANFHGQVIRLIEDNDNPEGTSFRFELFLAGGRESGLACPDNLAFDKRGNLWVACDMSARSMHKGQYQPFGNNGLYVVPTLGPGAGDAYQFASAPPGAELTGPWFTDDEQTLFLAVQHPGEGTTDRKKPTSRWPRGGNDLPRPSVMAITGFRW